MSRSTRLVLQLVVGVVVVALAALWVGIGGDDSGQGGDGASGGSSLETIAESELPEEGQETLDLVRSGGPFPYDRDGATFQNREGILPEQEGGYYREYTVPTPGSDDRGARRIVGGSDGDHYYTEDHYASFAQIEEGQ